MEDIFLAGPKHCGKTSTGKALASLLSRDFFDLDDLIMKRTGKTPRELYNESPQIFGEAEAAALAALLEKGGQGRIIALGGGIIDNRLVMLENRSCLVFLDLPSGSAWLRIAGSGELPPFLKTGNPAETHRALHERRAAAYRKMAKIIIEAEGKTPEEIAGEILKRL